MTYPGTRKTCMKFLVMSFVLLFTCGGFASDRILYNGKIITVNADFEIAQAIAIRDGRIFSVGSNAEIRALAEPSTSMVDLGGKTVTPGFWTPTRT